VSLSKDLQSISQVYDLCVLAADGIRMSGRSADWAAASKFISASLLGPL
jgi:hypothetical protein